MANKNTSRRAFTRFATVTSALIAPLIIWQLVRSGHSLRWAVSVTVVSIAAFRALVDTLFKRMLEHPDLFDESTPALRDADARYKRRLAFWSHKCRLLVVYLSLVTFVYLIQSKTGHHTGITWIGTASAFLMKLKHVFAGSNLQTLIQLPLLFFFNFFIFMGPMMLMGISQIRGFEPGDADWGVKLEDVRGQKEAKDEIKKIITLWQSGDKFAKAGGKRERGILFLGAPGTGKTMLAKAIATGFNCPIITIPGSGFAQTFVGIDVLVVRYMMRKAKKLAKKWDGQCIVFIDEIDAVGMRRNSLRSEKQETVSQMPGGMMGGMMGGMALNQLLVAMDGVDSPPFTRRVLTNKVNLYLDALYVIPAAVGPVRLRLPNAKPRGEQVYFVGATNVPLEVLDPALVRPGRMGRHIHFRTSTKRDRMDIFDLYLGKVKHDASLDELPAREELARVTNGYSPAQIEQACSLALMYSNYAGRDAFTREDILEAMVTVEAGTALGWGYEKPEEELSTAIHEAGHAVCAHIFMEGVESTRLSIRRRGSTGGHHQAVDTEERTFKNRLEVFNDLIWGLGAYAAEFVFYGHNTQGVGGDLQMTSYTAGTMVGRWGMAPLTDGLDSEIVSRLARIGTRLLTAAGPGDVKIVGPKYKDEATIMGHAFVIAYNTIIHNKLAVDKIAQRLVAEKEIYGDDLLKLLNGCSLEAPEIDFSKEESWPAL